MNEFPTSDEIKEASKLRRLHIKNETINSVLEKIKENLINSESNQCHFCVCLKSYSLKEVYYKNLLLDVDKDILPEVFDEVCKQVMEAGYFICFSSRPKGWDWAHVVIDVLSLDNEIFENIPVEDRVGKTYTQVMAEEKEKERLERAERVEEYNKADLTNTVSQTRVESFTEAAFNTVLGYITAMITQIIFYPIFDIHVGIQDQLLLALLFTLVSLLRNYFVRRVFNNYYKVTISWLTQKIHKCIMVFKK